MFGLYVGLFAAIAVLLLLMLAPAIEDWRIERRRRKRAGYLR